MIKKILKKWIWFNQKALGIDQLISIECEILSAQRLNSTISGSEWFKYQSISPGNMAVDYGFFLTLYRTLTSFKPRNILEFGLGQSSKMVHQYASYYGANAITVEHDETWAEFFKKGKEGDYPVNIKIMDLDYVEFKGKLVEVYKDCLETFRGQKFDMIIVDGPSSSFDHYSRIQILDLVKECLAKDFVVMVDDLNLRGEQNTSKEILRILDELKINKAYRIYKSYKKHILITNENNRFLTSLW